MIRKLLVATGLLVVSVIAFRYSEEAPSIEHSLSPTASGSRHSFTGAVLRNSTATRSAWANPTLSKSVRQPNDVLDIETRSVGESNKLLMQSARGLENNAPLQANLRYRINLFGQQITGPGFYVQQGEGSGRWRMELHHNSTHTRFRLAHLSDGRFYFRFQELDNKPELAFVDTFKLSNGELDRSSEVAAWTNPWSHVGGLSASLRHLAVHFDFETVTKSQLDDLEVYHVVGQWKPTAFARAFADSNQATSFEKQLPQSAPHVPHVVELMLGTEQDRFPLFPYRMVFYRFSGSNDDHGKSKSTRRSTPRQLVPIVQMEFFNLKHLEQSNASLFIVDSPANGSIDLTADYVEQTMRLME